MKHRSIVTKLAAMAIVAFVGVVGCSDMVAQPDNPSVEALAWQNQTLQDATPTELAGIDLEAAYAAKPSGGRGLKKVINFVESLDEEFEFSNRKWLVKAQMVWPDESTTITFGTPDVGYSTMEIPEGAIEEKTLFKLIVKLRGKRDLFLFPHGITFAEPVTVRFSLEGLSSATIARLMGLRLYYHNPESGGWEYIESYCDGDYVVATLEHFSRYAVGSDE
jgi:hypothetical protein